LDIVLRRELNPDQVSTSSEDTPDDEARVAPAPLTPAHRKVIEKLQLCHDLACQSLPECLHPAELTKVYHLQSAHEILKRLAEECGRVSDLKRAQANATFYSLKKPKGAPMQGHIKHFTSLQQEVNHHKESPLSDIQLAPHI
jgi:gag-polypeptide of LTR copia-type